MKSKTDYEPPHKQIRKGLFKKMTLLRRFSEISKVKKKFRFFFHAKINGSGMFFILFRNYNIGNALIGELKMEYNMGVESP